MGAEKIQMGGNDKEESVEELLKKLAKKGKKIKLVDENQNQSQDDIHEQDIEERDFDIED